VRCFLVAAALFLPCPPSTPTHPPTPPYAISLQEDDVIGVLTSGDNIAKLKPLGDRVLIKVRACWRAGHIRS
jgi:hypothetical protein